MRRGFYNEARDLAVYLSRLHTGKKLDEIGASFDIASYSTVSSIIIKMRERRKVDKALTKRLLEIAKVKGRLDPFDLRSKADLTPLTLRSKADLTPLTYS